MKVVMLKPKKGLGNIGEIVEVKPGYSRNYLIPKNIAIRATKQNLELFEKKKVDLQESNAKMHAKAKEQAKLVSNKDFTFIAQSSDDGRLYGSISSRDIANEISKIAEGVVFSQISLQAPIKSIGVFEVDVHLHFDVDAKVIVNVARSEAEAHDALTKFKNKVSNPEAEDFSRNVDVA
ncbi:MAG: 50S ribosomal protein L9 [Rickettsiaceae bacterium]|nr:50S ribosomal protein L9 [Rickettsiaceae bacterium]